jgi:hypothetical protein
MHRTPQANLAVLHAADKFENEGANASPTHIFTTGYEVAAVPVLG